MTTAWRPAASPPAARLDILIPPSIILVIYAAIAELSVPKLLAAGLFPGLMLTGLYMLGGPRGRLFQAALRPRPRAPRLARAHRRA